MEEEQLGAIKAIIQSDHFEKTLWLTEEMIEKTKHPEQILWDVIVRVWRREQENKS